MNKPSRNHGPHQKNCKYKNKRSGNDPEISVAMIMHSRESDKVHAKVAGQESQGQEDASHEGELHHALILAGTNSVEGQID
jgi:hypothetical protein